MIIILNFAPAPPISETQKRQILSSIATHLDERYVTSIGAKVIEVPGFPTVKQTMDSIDLDEAQWLNWPVIPRISGHPFADFLLAAVNERRGYPLPIVINKGEKQ